MATITQVKTGIANYLENEMITQLTGMQKWIVGAGLAMALDNADSVYAGLKENPIIQAMGIINGSEIDVDRIYKYILPEAEKSEVVIKMPYIGNIKMTASDVKKIYENIKEA